MDQKSRSVFSIRLQHEREKRRLSRIVMSELCGVSSNAISRYERGEREPSIKNLSAIADFLEVSTDYLIGRTDNRR